MTTAADQPATDAFEQFMVRYRDNPVLFVAEVLGVETIDPWQQAVMAAVARGDRRISIRSGHGVGKTTLLAWLVVWHICTRYPQATLCTAPTSAQLFDALARETFAWVSQLPVELRERLQVTGERIELIADPNKSFVSFKTSRPDTPEALAGVHSEHMLIIPDEASGIPEAVFEASAGSMSSHNACTVLAGNPVRTSGLFYDTHHDLSDIWTTFVVNCEDCTRVSKDFIEDMKRRYGANSNAYRVRVLGEFPKTDEDNVISYELMRAALSRDVAPIDVKPIWGVDCAGAGKDRTALSRRKGNVLEVPVQVWVGLETMEIVGHVKQLWDKTFPSQRPDDICVDAIGLGAGVANRLLELGLPARAVNVAESPAMGGLFTNLRAELWWTAREWFEARDCNLCGDKSLGKELANVKYKPTSNGKTQIEDKDSIRKRTKRSPDLADSFILTFAGSAISASSGSGSKSWSTPLKRGIKGIV